MEQKVRIEGHVRDRSGEPPTTRGTKVRLVLDGSEVRTRPIRSSDGGYVFANQVIEEGAHIQIFIDPPPGHPAPDPYEAVLAEGQLAIEAPFVLERAPIGQDITEIEEVVVVEVDSENEDRFAEAEQMITDDAIERAAYQAKLDDEETFEQFEEQTEQSSRQTSEGKRRADAETDFDIEELIKQVEGLFRSPEYRRRAIKAMNKRCQSPQSFIISLMQELTAIPGESDLCSCISDLADSDWPKLSNLCDEQTKLFINDIPDQLKDLAEECDQAKCVLEEELYSDIVGLSREKLGLIATRYSDRLADVMSSYKILYDQILLHTASQQLSVDFYENLKGDLAKPFECYQCLQQSMSSILFQVENGPVGVCLADLADACQDLLRTAEDNHDNLADLINTSGSMAPAAAVKYVKSLALWIRDLNAACLHTKRQEIDGAGDNIVELLHQDLTDIRQARDEIIALSNDLLVAVRRQQFLPSWRERASWLAEAKKGLLELGHGIYELIGGLQNCLELAETISDQETLSLQTVLTNYSSLSVGDPMAFLISILGNIAHKVQGSFSGWGGGSESQLVQTIKELNDNVGDIAAARFPSNGGYGSAGGIDGSSAGRRVENTIANVLGRHVKGPLAFRTALESTFLENPDTGKIDPKPARSVVRLTAGSGLLSASQGILSHEAGLIINDALEVLKGLQSIGPDTDKERAEALREIVRNEFEGLLLEAGVRGGARRSKTEEIIGQLVGQGGHLEQLRDELGLNSEGDNLSNQKLDTSEETQQMASMELLQQYASTLEYTFNRYFSTGSGKDPRNSSFSGRLAFVTTLFTVVASTLREVTADMDAAGFSEAERRTSFIIDPTVSSGTFRISIDGILSWIESFALEEGPDLIDRSGRIGLSRVIAIVNTRLTPMVVELRKISRGQSTLNPSAPHPGLRHGRVRNALEQLEQQLKQFNP